MNFSNNATFNTVVLVLGLILAIGLTQAGCQQASKDVAAEDVVNSHEGHEHKEAKTPPFMKVEDAELNENADLDAIVVQATAAIAKGREEGDMNLVMNEGIMKLKAVLDRDPENEKALLQLGLMSVESGQLEKAEKRFEKLVLLQPENQEYAKQLADIQSKLGK